MDMGTYIFIIVFERFRKRRFMELQIDYFLF